MPPFPVSETQTTVILPNGWVDPVPIVKQEDTVGGVVIDEGDIPKDVPSGDKVVYYAGQYYYVPSKTFKTTPLQTQNSLNMEAASLTNPQDTFNPNTGEETSENPGTPDWMLPLAAANATALLGYGAYKYSKRDNNSTTNTTTDASNLGTKAAVGSGVFANTIAPTASNIAKFYSISKPTASVFSSITSQLGMTMPRLAHSVDIIEEIPQKIFFDPNNAPVTGLSGVTDDGLNLIAVATKNNPKFFYSTVAEELGHSYRSAYGLGVADDVEETINDLFLHKNVEGYKGITIKSQDDAAGITAKYAAQYADDMPKIGWFSKFTSGASKVLAKIAYPLAALLPWGINYFPYKNGEITKEEYIDESGKRSVSGVGGLAIGTKVGGVCLSSGGAAAGPWGWGGCAVAGIGAGIFGEEAIHAVIDPIMDINEDSILFHTPSNQPILGLDICGATIYPAGYTGTVVPPCQGLSNPTHLICPGEGSFDSYVKHPGNLFHGQSTVCYA